MKRLVLIAVAVVEDMQDPSGAYPRVTGAAETASHLYVASLTAGSLRRLPPPLP